MNIGVYVPPKNVDSSFIVGTFFPLFRQLGEHRFILITDEKNEVDPVFNFEKVAIKPQPKNLLLKNLWIERTLTNVLKKIKADVFICADNFCSLKSSLPQIILIPDPDKLKPTHAKKARLLIAISETEKKNLIEKFRIPENKIEVVYPSVNKKYLPINTEIKESIKNKYSEGKEFFLCCSSLKEDDLIKLLKAFSHFKKRQQSSFKLLILTEGDALAAKSIENYKYRNDISIINPKNIEEAATMTSAAYTLVLPFDKIENISTALNAMRSGVPVIVTKNSSVNEIAGGSVLCAEDDIKDIGEKMMQLYKDETLRSQIIEKGKGLVKNYTEESSAGQLLRSITKALN